ncbi:GNAT family N-acetyltransferase [Proteiniclasticum sp.]|uniref:GNAT family N-acetyltransferase n=1 Tax=Proteiniclasticum sp. TaxID=2053595 RepID=UPI00289ED3CA|nr:GNAT family N-acetyltransferase [Proteiniclasticum sp.]
MHNDVTYRELKEDDISLALFEGFKRHQEVKRCWRKIDGTWMLKEIAFIEEWGSEEYAFLVRCLINTVNEGGTVWGAFHESRLYGFASLENRFFGKRNHYLQLSSIHISDGYRGQGIGKVLFSLASDQARERGAEKLYISAHSSEETQAFYRKAGCVEASEYNERLSGEEPCDCQLEYAL